MRIEWRNRIPENEQSYVNAFYRNIGRAKRRENKELVRETSWTIAIKKQKNKINPEREETLREIRKSRSKLEETKDKRRRACLVREGDWHGRYSRDFAIIFHRKGDSGDFPTLC